MGWTSYKIDTADKTDAVMRRELNCTSIEHGTWEVTDSATVGAQWYGIIKRTPVVGEPIYYGMVCLTERKQIKGTGMTDFGFKDMTEDMCPYYFAMPLKMLNKLEALSPVEQGQYAHKWREGVRMYHAKRAEKAKAKRDNLKKLQDFLKAHIQVVHIGGHA